MTSMFRILVLSEDICRLDFVSNTLVESGYTVTSVTSCGLAIELMAKTNAFHIVFFDGSMQGISVKKIFAIFKKIAEDICIIVFTPNYTVRNSKLYLEQGAQLVLPYGSPYDKLNSVYSVLWQFFFTNKIFNSDLRNLQPLVTKKMHSDDVAKEELEQAGPECTPRDVTELMTVSGIRSQSDYLGKNPVPRARALGTCPSRARALGTGLSRAPLLSLVEQIAQAETPLQHSTFSRAGAADEAK